MDWMQVIGFWFEEIKASKHWVKDEAFDRLIAERFGAVHTAAAQAELFQWRQQPQGRLAEIIVLDQFSRNIYRDQAAAFACDAQALVLAQEAVALGVDQQLEPTQRTFLYMPYMHSESALIHQQAVELFQQPGLEDNYSFELKHKEIIDRFGRYPHRNAILGRDSSAEEREFLTQPGSSF
ncbi:DUF924 family protein [Motiliproteus sp.]|uniref:DUF924 family protein n=1 Tax=Motiliproteus sp. TaxID=1898955 RepID=UPI003BAA41D8